MLIKQKCYVLAHNICDNARETVDGWQSIKRGIKAGDLVFYPSDSSCSDTNLIGEAKIWADKKVAQRKLEKEILTHPTSRLIELEVTAEIE